MTPVKLNNKKEIFAAVDKAFAEGTLQIFKRNLSTRSPDCEYRRKNSRGKVYCCAIGCLLTEEQFKDIDQAWKDKELGVRGINHGVSIDELLDNKLIVSKYPGLLKKLQVIHDECYGYTDNQQRPKYRAVQFQKEWKELKKNIQAHK